DPADATRLLEFSEQISDAANSEINAIAKSGELDVLMATYPDRSNATQYAPVPRVVVDRLAALIGAWYEFFPRSAEGRGDRGSTFRDRSGQLAFERQSRGSVVCCLLLLKRSGQR